MKPLTCTECSVPILWVSKTLNRQQDTCNLNAYICLILKFISLFYQSVSVWNLLIASKPLYYCISIWTTAPFANYYLMMSVSSNLTMMDRSSSTYDDISQRTSHYNMIFSMLTNLSGVTESLDRFRFQSTSTFEVEVKMDAVLIEKKNVLANNCLHWSCFAGLISYYWKPQCCNNIKKLIALDAHSLSSPFG